MTMFAVLGFVAAMSGVKTGNAATMGDPQINPGATQYLVLAAAKKKPAGKVAQCKALNKCRWYYAHCEKKVYGGMKPGPKRDVAKEACVDKYRTCIKENFNGTDMLFIRWFWPGECPH